MSKLLGVLIALVLLGAFPAVAGAQGTEPAGGGDTISSGNEQDADIEQEAEAGGGNAGHQAGGHFREHGGGRVHGGGGDVDGGGGAGGGVGGVTLARTGFDAWILAVLGGLSLAGGIGLLAAQRRGRPNV